MSRGRRQPPSGPGTGSCILHASAVAVEGRGLLLSGPAGAGKSTLALAMMALGAELVADDRVQLVRREDTLVAECPPTIRGLIEARGLGILRVDPVAGPVPAVALVDLALPPPSARLPERARREILGVHLEVIAPVDSPHFPAMLMQYLKGGRHG